MPEARLNMKSESDNTKANNQESIHAQYKKMADEAVTLRIFDIIEQNPRTSQQKITMQTGLTTGLVHSFMKRVIKKGWIRAKQVNAKRWLYFITPEGFTEKSRLTMGYLSRTLNAYRSAQKIVQVHLGKCYENNWLKLIVAGDNELAEIAALNIQASNDLTLVAVVAESGNYKTIAGESILPFSKIESINYHKLLVCDPSFTNWNIKNGVSLNNSKILSIFPSHVGQV